MAEAVANDRFGREEVEIDRVKSGARHMEKSEPLRPRKIPIECEADDHLGGRIGFAICRRRRIRLEDSNLRRDVQQVGKAITVGARAFTMEDDTHQILTLSDGRQRSNIRTKAPRASLLTCLL